MRVLAILACLAILGCQQHIRQARPIALAQPGDLDLSCDDLAAMQTANAARAAELRKLDEGVAMGNGLAVVISKAMFFPAALGVDLSDAEEIEARAFEDRNGRLAEIAGRKRCVEKAAIPAAPGRAGVTPPAPVNR